MTAESDDPRLVPSQSVVYDVGDLLDRLGTRLDAGFATINTKLDSKADKTDLARINARIDEHSVQIRNLEQQQLKERSALEATQAERDIQVSKYQFRWNITLTALMVAVSAGLVIVGIWH